MHIKRWGLLLVASLLLLGGTISSAAAESNLIQNAWALGVDNVSGCPGDIHSAWVHSETVTLSQCPKNPSPYGPGQPGAAFKNGPVQGLGTEGVETVSYQEFALPLQTSHTLQFQTLLVCVRCDYLKVSLYGDGQYLGSLLDFDPNTSVPDYYYQSGNRLQWPHFTGPELTVGQYATYRVEIRTLFTAGNSLGVKWTGMLLTEH